MRAVARAAVISGLGGLGGLLGALGCASKSEHVVPTPAEPLSVQADPAAEDPALKVLVTGFNDWKDLGTPPNVWRCRDNPSCRLLLGDPHSERPAAFDGPLVYELVAANAQVDWSFQTMPVTWEVARELPEYEAYDVVVHLGLGVYDRTDEVFVEAGAWNHRVGVDAAGRSIDAPILEAQGQTIEAPADAPIADRVASIDGRTFGPITARAMAARQQNAYLCNETHAWALDAVARDAVDAAYFVHVPYAEDDDHAALAKGVAGVVVALIAQ